MTRRRHSALLATVLVLVQACAVNPATGSRELSLVSEGQEIAMGQEGARQTLASMPLVADSAVQQYVRGVAMRLVGVAERPTLPWAFHVLDDATVNAFAYPGGFIFMTRGILTHMNDEAELAGVLGHEIGHVTARHTANQITRAQLATAGLVVGSIVSETFASVAEAAGGAGLGLLFMKFGRDAEYQADELGFRYMTRDGYDPRRMSSMFTMLQRQSVLGGGGRLPEWQSTHPDPENRVGRNDERVAAFEGDPAALKSNREAFLRILDGMVFGDDPRQGFFEGAAFHHPELRFSFGFPDGWQARNEPTRVAAMSPAQDAIVALSFAKEATPDAALRAFMSQEGLRPGVTSRAPVNGIPAVTGEFTAQPRQGGTVLAGAVQFIQYGGRVYQVLGYTSQEKVREYAAVFQGAFRSFAELRDPALLGRQPVRVRILTVPRSMTLREAHRQQGATIEVERMAVINGMGVDDVVPAGSRIKVVR